MRPAFLNLAAIQRSNCKGQTIFLHSRSAQSLLSESDNSVAYLMLWKSFGTRTQSIANCRRALVIHADPSSHYLIKRGCLRGGFGGLAFETRLANSRTKRRARVGASRVQKREAYAKHCVVVELMAVTGEAISSPSKKIIQNAILAKS